MDERGGVEQRREQGVPRKSSRQDKNEGAMDKAKGRLKEATGALSGDKEKKAEGRSDQRGGTAKEKEGALKDLLKLAGRSSGRGPYRGCGPFPLGFWARLAG